MKSALASFLFDRILEISLFTCEQPWLLKTESRGSVIQTKPVSNPACAMRQCYLPPSIPAFSPISEDNDTSMRPTEEMSAACLALPMRVLDMRLLPAS